MTILLEDRLTEDISIRDMAKYDTKANILESFEILGVKVPKSYKKDVLVDILQDIFDRDPFLFVNSLPKEEQKLVVKLMNKQQQEFIARPRNDEDFLSMQRVHLVVTYQGKDYWHIYMPDSVREKLNESANRDLNLYPGMRELHATIEKLNVVNDSLFNLMNEEKGLSPKEIRDKVSGLKVKYDEYKRELERQDAKAREYKFPIDDIYSSIEEQKKLCDIASLCATNHKAEATKEEKAVENYVMMLSAKRQQEMEDAEKNQDKPIVFHPAITCNPPLPMESFENFKLKIIRPTVLEAVVRLTHATFMVSYFILQNGYVHVACCWDDILDFVWKGVEEPTPRNPYMEIKKHFRKKYPIISSLFGQKENKNGVQIQEPYLTTIGFDHQPKKWWLSTKMMGKSGDDFARWACLDVTGDEDCAFVLGNLRDACLDIFDEINDSDAKSPKEMMHKYFEVRDIEEIVDVFVKADEQ